MRKSLHPQRGEQQMDKISNFVRTISLSQSQGRQRCEGKMRGKGGSREKCRGCGCRATEKGGEKKRWEDKMSEKEGKSSMMGTGESEVGYKKKKRREGEEGGKRLAG